MKKITVTVGAVTYAIKARNLLSRGGIRSKLVKIDSSASSPGCTHGLEISENDLYDLAALLREHGIGYSVIKESRDIL